MKKQILFIFLCSISIYGQKEIDSVSTEVIHVITSYRPAISDAFKENENPTISIENKDKNKIQYKIKSDPIKSIFKPFSGGYKATKTKREESKLPDYLKIGLGNFGTTLIEGFAYKQKDEHEGQVFLYHKASNGGIKNIALRDDYLNTKIALNYKNSDEIQIWEVGADYQKDIYNWYGIPFEYDENLIGSINEKQTYNSFTLNGSIELKNEWIKKSDASIGWFSDRQGSMESRILFSPTFSIPLKKNEIETKVILDILHGEFENSYFNSESINYGYLSFGAEGSFPIEKENLFISIGAKLVYNSDLEKNKGNLYIYPNIKAELSIIDELLNIYTGLTGGLNQNSFRSISRINPYVSPTLNIKPTSNTFNVFIGLKGKLTSRIDYDLNASYSQEKDMLLYRSNKNLTDGTQPILKGYQAGNSFYTAYDNVSDIGLFGKLSANFNESIKTGLTASIHSYSMKNEKEPWNLPLFTASSFTTYSIHHWMVKAEIFLRGKRKDLEIASDDTETQIELDAYADFNVSAIYNFNKKWSAFIELNNILNTNYQVYSNFQVQGFQILAGGIYRFDL